jgi:hypothetical protein
MKIRLKPYLQPFERLLASREFYALTGQTPALDESGDTWAEVPKASTERIQVFATYWDQWSEPAKGWPRQVSREASIVAVRNSIDLTELHRSLPTQSAIHFPNRRVLRYGPHGIHEYRGKFFPQLVQALTNIAGLEVGQSLFDPMCGSGTTLVEGALRGAQVVGADMNPLSILISRAKLDALIVAPPVLQEAYESLRKTLLAAKTPTSLLGTGWFRRLAAEDQQYLARWFPASTLLALDRIMHEILGIKDARVKRMFLVSLSNVLRPLSYQKVDDLRVRRDEKLDEDHDPYREFLDELSRSVRSVLALRWQQGRLGRIRSRIEQGDARRPIFASTRVDGKFDLCITSPPYATALPYLDTDRLSLIYLGLTSRSEQRRLESEMIGNRELTETLRRQIKDGLSEERKLLPASIWALVNRIERLNGTTAGFRRRNLPLLLAKYFADMRQTLAERVDIRTQDLLCEIAESVGLSVRDTWSMEVLRSRDIFRENASSSETILWLASKKRSRSL